MTEMTINFKNLQDISDFVSILNKETGEFDLVSGRNVVDAKSILGVLSLDLSRPLKLIIYQKNESLISKLTPYLE